MRETVNGRISFWYESAGLPQVRPALRGRATADVCIVGGGLSGLWTAYYLKKSAPGLKVAVVEQRFCGYGASGRNGGWLSGTVPGSRRRYAAEAGLPAVTAMQRLLNQTIDEVISVAAAEGIEADIVKGGLLLAACTPSQLARAAAMVEDEHRWGNTGWVLLSAGQARARIRVDGALGGAYSPHCAVIQPARLVQGLARVVAGLGVDIYEDSRVTRIAPRLVSTPAGEVSAPLVIRATEGFTAGLKGLRRTWLPLNSSIVVTEPLSQQQWEEIGWTAREALGDLAHAYMYAQRTADGRIALGGRGIPYRFGSKTDFEGHTGRWTIDSLRQILVRMFPALRGTQISQAWSGVLGVPRDWCATVGLDQRTGLGWAGGYVGSGVSATNLAGRTLRDLVLGEQTELTALPWVGRRVRQWEPEPLRWVGVQAMYATYRWADERERASLGATSRLARLADTVSGRH